MWILSKCALHQVFRYNVISVIIAPLKPPTSPTNQHRQSAPIPLDAKQSKEYIHINRKSNVLLEIHACSNPRLTNQKCNYILGT